MSAIRVVAVVQYICYRRVVPVVVGVVVVVVVVRVRLFLPQIYNVAVMILLVIGQPLPAAK